MNNGFNMKTLKLDATYRPVAVVDCIEALVLCIVGKATAVEEYEQRIYSPSVSFKIPSVIVLKNIVKYFSNGFTPNRPNVIWRDNNTCQYCNKKFLSSDLTLDHVMPKSRGGENIWTNLVASCKKCNQKKGNKTPEEADMKLIKKPVKPSNSILRHTSEIDPIWGIYLWTPLHRR
jgi:5-methylcytosine-specific restriction endonuclease McrA|tara:strand:- start:1120 stop:1644 length:525 start_codon:yes stop_codon:yes gene_type:complete